MDETNAAPLPELEPYPAGYVPQPDEILDDILVALGRVSRRLRAGESMLSMAVDPRAFEALARVAANMAKITRELRNPVDDAARLRAIVEKMRADGVGSVEARN